MHMVWRHTEDYINLAKVKNTGNVRVMELGKGNMDTFHNLLGIVNEIYDRLTKAKLDSEIMEYIKFITESLNNLAYFQVEIESENGEEIAAKVMERFKNFKYKAIENMDRPRDIKVYRTKSLSKAEANEVLKVGKETGYFTAPDNEEYFRLINCNATPRIIVVMENGKNETVLKELIEIYKKSCNIKVSRKYLKEKRNFTVDKSGFYSELMWLIASLFQTLVYILNSYSFEKGKCYPFDAMEFRRRLAFSLEDQLDRARRMAIYQLEG